MRSTPRPFQLEVGGGVVSAFDFSGNLLSRVATGGVLEAPSGIAKADPNFGAFGDGRINAFHENADGTWTPQRNAEGPRRPAAGDRRPLGAPVRLGRGQQRPAQPPALHLRQARQRRLHARAARRGDATSAARHRRGGWPGRFSAAPTNLLTYTGPVSNDPVTIDFKQSIGAGEALRTGAYTKTFTFSLSTTTP